MGLFKTKMKARSGDAEAMYDLAMDYYICYNQTHSDSDYRKYQKYLHMAIEHDHLKAVLHAAYDEVDMQREIQLCEQAARLGSLWAQDILAEAYFQGYLKKHYSRVELVSAPRGCDLAECRRRSIAYSRAILEQKVADEDRSKAADAAIRIGLCYAAGEGVEADPAEAEAWLQKAYSLGATDERVNQLKKILIAGPEPEAPAEPTPSGPIFASDIIAAMAKKESTPPPPEVVFLHHIDVSDM